MNMDSDLSELLCTMLRSDRAEVAIAILAEPDCDVHQRSSGDQTPLHIAADVHLHGVVALLLVKGADPRITRTDRRNGAVRCWTRADARRRAGSAFSSFM
ncbi:MAG: hypothetical protein JNK84_10850 [Phreatobacter sp.]|uniref:hypothetical protein n=1 Tax=Phreatobacter sp. TaxID=1966341 RepID=UPI001A3DD3A9|nr:hypothetical protein [Phreatobacter sp.]MBL8569571.1 hypothetical protein [Phreatobacter sp.]